MYPVSGPESVDNSTNESLGWIGRTSKYCRNQGDEIIEFEIRTLPTRQCPHRRNPAQAVPYPLGDTRTLWSAEADALRRANEICVGAVKIPVVWYNYHSEFYGADPLVPSWDRVYSPDELRDIGASHTLSRDEGLALISEEGWDSHTHLGNVPSTQERMKCVNNERFSSPLAPSVEVGNKPDSNVQSDSADQILRDFRLGKIPKTKIAYVFIEFCCSPDSRLSGDEYGMVDGKHVLRVRCTEMEDMTKQKHVQNVLDIIEECKGLPIVLWGSQPCTAGAGWQRLNKTKSPHYEERMRFLMGQFKELHSNFIKLATAIAINGLGRICFEWPQYCDLWKQRRVVQMIKRFKLEIATFNGCMLGLRSSKDRALKKPWKVASNIPTIVEILGSPKYKCDKSHEHDKIAGSETARSSYYPKSMTDNVHKSIWASLAYNNSDPVWITAIPETLPVLSHSVPAIDPPKVDAGVQINTWAKEDLVPFSPRNNVLALEPSATSVAVASLFDVENLWIVDTGCGNDLISVAKAMFLEHMFQFAPKINFSTANGVHSTSKCLPLFFSVNDEEYVARPYIMSATPPVLSVGLRTMNQGFAFIWLPGLLLFHHSL